MAQKDEIISKCEDTEDKFLQALLLKSAKIEKNLIGIKEHSTNDAKDNNDNEDNKDDEDNKDNKDEDNKDNKYNNEGVNQVKYSWSLPCGITY